MNSVDNLKASFRRVLLVDDSPEDREATRRAFRKVGLSDWVVSCEDGDEALDYLHRRGKYESPESSPRPGVILLDLNMPGTDGREVLEDVKNDSELRSIPVIVLTTSSDPRDVAACYSIGANTYMQKPVDLAGFLAAVQRLKDYWFGMAILPEEGSDVR